MREKKHQGLAEKKAPEPIGVVLRTDDDGNAVTVCSPATHMGVPPPQPVPEAPVKPSAHWRNIGHEANKFAQEIKNHPDWCGIISITAAAIGANCEQLAQRLEGIKE